MQLFTLNADLLKHVVASTSEAECGALFHNSQLLVPIKITLEELIHKKITTPLIPDYSTAAGFFNKEIKKLLQNLGYGISLDS